MLIDGALGTELERIGCDLSGKLWSGKVLRENPEQIARVHEAYLEAGAEYALLGATMAPGFDYADYVTGERAPLIERYPDIADEIRRLTRDS